jgi:polysaccharide biosynthesis/export protein
MSVRLKFVAVGSAVLLSGCAHLTGDTFSGDMMAGADAVIAADAEGSIKDGPPIATTDGYPVPVTSGEALPPVSHVAWGEPTMVPHDLQGPQAVADTDGPYLLDTGDRMRIFVYGQPNLSRLYIVDHDGKIAVPLIGEISARGKTTSELQGTIRARLGAEFVKDPQVTVDVQQNRPFFILGEVKNAGQFPYVSGMTVETAIAIAGGYTERASTRKYRITRRINGFVEQIEAPGDYVVKAGDTVHVFERFF